MSRQVVLAALLLLGHARAEVVTITAANATTELHNIIVYFYAPWCSTCKKLRPTWEAFSEVDLGAVRVGQVDITREKSLAEQYAIRAFPTVLYFPGTLNESIYRYGGVKEIEDMKAYVTGGWNGTAEYDPSKAPARPPRKSTKEVVGQLTSKNKRLFTFVGAMVFVAIVLKLLLTPTPPPPAANDDDHDRSKGD